MYFRSFIPALILGSSLATSEIPIGGFAAVVGITCITPPHAARPQASTSTLNQLRNMRPRDSGFCLFFMPVQLLNAAEQRTRCSGCFSYDGDERNVFRKRSKWFMVRMESSTTFYVQHRTVHTAVRDVVLSSHRKKPAVPVSANANFWIKNFIYRSLPAYLPLEHPYALASDKSRVGYRGSILARLQRRLCLPFPLYV